jgi:hypothetical protein
MGPKDVIVAWTTGEDKYVKYALNLAISADRLGLRSRFVVVAMDDAAVEGLRGHGFRIVLSRNEGTKKDKIWKMRWWIAIAFLRLGLRPIVVDSDAVFIRDPFSALQRDADIELSTDLYFPERDLFQPWFRPEDHVNTGFLSVHTERAATFLRRFLNENFHATAGGLLRDGFDQRNFGIFLSRACAAGELEVVYEGKTIGKPNASAVRIRIISLDLVPHGMAYFYLRNREKAVFAHVNGVSDKEYFMRDRGLWPLNDSASRFPTPRFLTYDHPGGLSLAEDFNLLWQAHGLAYRLKRRLVLPRTMNCANCPAERGFGPWNFSECTLDYFLHIRTFNLEYGRSTVEAGIQDLSWYQSLTHSVVPSAGMDREAESVEVLHASPAQLAEMRINAHESMCGYLDHLDLVRKFACRDDAWSRAFGGSCWPPAHLSPQRGSCVTKGIICCDNTWGWAEKLEYFTGVAWDLPCDCGLRVCEDCCAHDSVERVGHLSAAPVVSPCAPYGRADEAETNIHEWALAPSSSLVRALATKAISPETAWEVCQTHLAFSRNMTGPSALQLCDLAFMSFLNASGSDTKPWTRFADRFRTSEGKRFKNIRTNRSEL